MEQIAVETDHVNFSTSASARVAVWCGQLRVIAQGDWVTETEVESRAGLVVEQCVDKESVYLSEEDASGDGSEVVSLERIKAKDCGMADNPWRGTM